MLLELTNKWQVEHGSKKLLNCFTFLIAILLISKSKMIDTNIGNK